MHSVNTLTAFAFDDLAKGNTQVGPAQGLFCVITQHSFVFEHAGSVYLKCPGQAHSITQHSFVFEHAGSVYLKCSGQAHSITQHSFVFEHAGSDYLKCSGQTHSI